MVYGPIQTGFGEYRGCRIYYCAKRKRYTTAQSSSDTLNGIIDLINKEIDAP